jgi:hypothetical protein
VHTVSALADITAPLRYSVNYHKPGAVSTGLYCNQEKNKMATRLQVKVNGKWEYVGCKTDGRLIITKAREKALRARDLAVFQQAFPTFTFRTQNGAGTGTH